MARIKVVGYIDPDSLEDGEADLEHPMGLSDEAFTRLTNDLSSVGVEDAEFSVVEDNE